MFLLASTPIQNIPSPDIKNWLSKWKLAQLTPVKRSRACLPIASDCWVEPSQTSGPREAHAILSCTKLHSLLDVQSGLLGKFQVLHLIHHPKKMNPILQYDDYNGKCFAHIRHISMIFGASQGPKMSFAGFRSIVEQSLTPQRTWHSACWGSLSDKLLSLRFSTTRQCARPMKRPLYSGCMVQIRWKWSENVWVWI